MNEQSLLDAFVQRLPGLPPETVAAVRKIMRVDTIPPGTVIMTEGEFTDSLYFIESGSVDVFCEVGNTDESDEQLLASLSGAAILGEKALLDGKPRSASVRAATQCRLMEIRPNDILALPNGERILDEIRRGLTTTVIERMRAATRQYAASLDREMAGFRERQQFGQFFVYTLAMMTIGMLVNDILAKQILKVDIYTPTFAWVYLLIILLPTSVLIWRMKIPLRDLGVTTIGIKKSLIEGAALSVVILGVAFVTAWGLRTLNIKTGTPVPADWAGTTGYFFHSVLQELVARGLMQSSFQRFLGDTRGFRSVVLASVLFGAFHIHFGLLAVVTTVFSGLLFGALYLRHRNLAGVTLLHFFAGGAAFWSGLI